VAVVAAAVWLGGQEVLVLAAGLGHAVTNLRRGGQREVGSWIRSVRGSVDRPLIRAEAFEWGLPPLCPRFLSALA